MHLRHSIALASLSAAALLVACAAGGFSSRETAAQRGARLYTLHCAVCHGANGAGDGPAAELLMPPARDFTRGEFRLVSTDNGAPTQADLVATLARGIPGSAMPAWSWMPRESLEDLAAHVRELARQGLAQRLVAASTPPIALDAALAQADQRLTPGAAVALPHPQAAMGAVYELGRQSYARNCAACHGPEGRGEQTGPELNADGSPNWARDFTAGFLKGGGSHRALATRIVAGLPGTSMPSFANLPSQELEALATYVSSLVPINADSWLVHRQGTLQAKRVNGGEPLAAGCDATDERFERAAELDVVLAPLAWRNDALFAAKVSAIHDGQSIALRVRWRDATRDEGAFDPAQPRDGAAFAFSNESAPPLFGMGSRSHPVNLWHWQALRLIDRAGVLDLVDAQPHVLSSPVFGESRADVKPHYLPAPSEPVAGGGVDALSAESFRAVRELGASAKSVAGSARWAGGEWAVVFVRELAPRNESEADLRRGRPVVVALALWDGSGGDIDGYKSFSIWQKLAIE